MDTSREITDNLRQGAFGAEAPPQLPRLLLQLPNLLTFLRLALIPVLVITLVRGHTAAALLVFISASMTDFLDGFIARKWGAVSDLGKLLDPLADKILVMSALVVLVGVREEVLGYSVIPAWLVVLILAREFWVTGLRGVAASRGLVIAADSSGKWKSALQMGAICLLIAYQSSIELPVFGQFSCHIMGLNLIFLSLALSYWGAVDYTVTVIDLVTRQSRATD